jgi:SAM-dependent methyltransferase
LPARGVLLDYGAGDGAVLKSAGKLLPEWELHALDIADKFREEILRLPCVVAFTSGDPAQLPRAHFDLVVLWHTLEHVPEPAGMLRSFHRWLKPEGQVLVQVPDVERNPYDLGVVDHVSHFTNATLRSCARKAGFEIATDGHPWTHNCLTLLLGHPELVTESALGPSTVAASSDPFEWLNAQIQFFVGRVGNSSYSIFGTGMASLLLAAQLPGSPQCFLDEDDRRVGGEINGIPIVHPLKLQATIPIIMPFLAETARAIAHRLASQSPGLKAEQFVYAD